MALKDHLQGIRDRNLVHKNGKLENFCVPDKEYSNIKKRILRLTHGKSIKDLERFALESREELIEKIASDLHTNWQNTSGYKNRWRKFFMDEYLGDEKEILEQDKEAWKSLVKKGKAGVNHEGLVVDIQNTCYEDLSYKWQKENKAAASFVLDIILNPKFQNMPIDLEFIETVANLVHEAWLERNGSHASPEQRLKYTKMDEQNKNKDRVHVIIALENYYKFRENRLRNAERNKKIPA